LGGDQAAPPSPRVHPGLTSSPWPTDLIIQVGVVRPSHGNKETKHDIAISNIVRQIFWFTSKGALQLLINRYGGLTLTQPPG